MVPYVGSWLLKWGPGCLHGGCGWRTCEVQGEEPLPDEGVEGVGVAQRGTKPCPPVDTEVRGTKAAGMLQLRERFL